MRELGTDIRVAVLAAISPLVVEGVTIPVFDSFLPPSVNTPSFMSGIAYVLITDQNEAETTNNDCSIRQNVNLTISIITKFPQGSGGKKASETISNAIQNKMVLADISLPGYFQAINLRKNFSRTQIEEGVSQIGYQKILSYTFDIFQVS
jgi:hypothetical protein